MAQYFEDYYFADDFAPPPPWEMSQPDYSNRDDFMNQPQPEPQRPDVRQEQQPYYEPPSEAVIPPFLQQAYQQPTLPIPQQQQPIIHASQPMSGGNTVSLPFAQPGQPGFQTYVPPGAALANLANVQVQEEPYYGVVGMPQYTPPAYFDQTPQILLGNQYNPGRQPFESPVPGYQPQNYQPSPNYVPGTGSVAGQQAIEYRQDRIQNAKQGAYGGQPMAQPSPAPYYAPAPYAGGGWSGGGWGGGADQMGYYAPMTVNQSPVNQSPFMAPYGATHNPFAYAGKLKV